MTSGCTLTPFIFFEGSDRSTHVLTYSNYKFFNVIFKKSRGKSRDFFKKNKEAIRRPYHVM